MGWVTLTLRKKELTYTHSYYQLEDLKISREKRQLAREKAYNTTVINNDQSDELSERKSTYSTDKSEIRDKIQAIRDYASENEGIDTSTYAVDGKTITDYQQDLSDAQETYQEEVNSIKDFYDSELEMLEDEASDEETMLDDEQSDIEAQMEAVAQELSSVGDSISTEIQNTTIKLS